MAKKKARNTRAYIAFNEDFQPNGRYYRLDDGSLSALMRLHSYADGEGQVRRHDGRGYTTTELQVMLNQPYRGVRRSKQALTVHGLIRVNYEGVIQIMNFVEDNVYRLQDKKGIRQQSIFPDSKTSKEEILASLKAQGYSDDEASRLLEAANKAKPSQKGKKGVENG
jgi:hypothetical protein